MDIRSSIEALLKEILEEEYFIVEIQFVEKRPVSKLTLLIDGDKGITIDKCADISREIAEKMDALDLIPQKYTLEVSSPGVDKPLTLKRQYAKNIGRSLKIQLRDGAIHTGVLQAVEEESILIQKEKNKKEKDQDGLVAIAFQHIHKATVLISFT